MCGIVGFLDKRRELPDPEATGRVALGRITHRGPDAQGGFVDRAAGVWLGHARLKIIDLSENGAQPMRFGPLILTYNGEIYNFGEIRAELSAAGYTFVGTSDTEVLLKGWDRWGLSIVGRLRGIFAFAIYDERARKIFLVRDHLGVKPLYLVNDGRYFAFASEPKAFGALPSFAFEIATEHLPEYLAYRFVQAPDTLLRGVSVLPPGCYAVYDCASSELATTEYWRLRHRPEFAHYSAAEAAEHFQELFQSIVAEQAVADVPLGILLSGGIDSSLVAKYLSQVSARAGHELVAYTVDFPQPELSEANYSRQIVERFGLAVNRYVFDEAIMSQALDRTAYHVDEPISQPHTPYFYLLAEKIKEKLTVVLSGEGADEVFAGYSRYGVFAQSQTESQVEAFALGSTRFLGNDAIAAALGIPAAEADARATAKRRRLLDEFRGEFSGLALAQAVDLRTYLVSLLNRIDKTTMAYAVEARVPFLDPRLVEFGCSLPAAVKVHPDRAVTKFFLKTIAEREFGADFAYRRKVGFHAPFRGWLRDMAAVRSALSDRLNLLPLSLEWVRTSYERFLRGEPGYEPADTTWIVYNLANFRRQYGVR